MNNKFKYFKIKEKKFESNTFSFMLSTFLVFNCFLVVLVNSQSLSDDVSNKLMCTHPTYPCFYYECSRLSTINLNDFSSYFRCAKGLIFDEKSQHCIWTLPWKACQLTEPKDSSQPSDQFTSNGQFINPTTTSTVSAAKEVKPMPSLVFNGNKKLGEKVERPTPNSLFEVLSSKDARQAYLNSLYGSTKPTPVEAPPNNNEMFGDSELELENDDDNEPTDNDDSGNLIFHLKNRLNDKRDGDNFRLSDESIAAAFNAFKNPTNLNNLVYKNKGIQYYDSDFNVTIDNKAIDYDEQSQQQPSDQYAYIIVPIKIAKNRKLPDLSSMNANSNVKSEKRKSKKAKPAKNYDDIFRYKKVCYVTNWSQYRPKPAQFTPDNVDPFLCTHLVYAFAYIDNLTLTIKTIEENDEEMYRRINDLKYKNPKLKTMLGVGGWNMKSKEFSTMVKRMSSREHFINHAIRFLRYYGFDGIDLDWEFPGDRGGSPEDKPNFALLLKEFRVAINEEAYAENRDPLILSIAVAAGKRRIDQGYDIKKIVPECDFINLMTFDFHGSWDSVTGLNAPLYNHENVTKDEMELNQDWSVSYWIKNGCPPHKLILGLPAYGRTFSLKDKSKNGILAESFQNGTQGNFTKTSGFLSYYEICELKRQSNWTTVWLPQSKSHYMYKDNDWISYDDIKSFHLRTAYVVAKKLGGIFIWSIDMDDFSGKFCKLGAYPLIKNSMSLLMDYLPEWYSSNVNQPKKGLSAADRERMIKLQQDESQNPSKMFYVLKDEQLNLDEPAFNSQYTQQQQQWLSSKALQQQLQLQSASGSKNYEQEFDLIKQNRIRNDLLLMLTQQPQKFVQFNLPDTFNCTNKQKGFHRDPFDCTKYYFCNDATADPTFNSNTGSSTENFLLSRENTNVRIENQFIQTKAYTCPKNTIFNMNGCYCERETSQNSNCHYLSDTYCDFGLFRSVDKKFAK